MEKIHVDLHENILDVVRKLRAVKDSTVEIHIPEGSVLFDNSLNLKLLMKEASVINKEISFKTNDIAGRNIIENLEGVSEDTDEDFVSREVSVASVLTEKSKKGNKRKLVPSISLPKFSMSVRLPILLGVFVAFGLFAFGIYTYLWKVPKANISVRVTSQPLIKSVEISVKPGVVSNVEQKILGGYVVETTATEMQSASPTGEKTVGKKATGKIKIVSRTTEDKEFKKGENLYSTDDEDLFYLLDDDVDVPKASLQDPMDISSPLIPGTAEVDVTAEKIGKEYNLSDGEDLEFDDFDSEKYIAEVVDDIKGGESKVVKVVSQADIDKISSELLKKSQEKGFEIVSKGISSEQVVIEGSVTSSLSKQEFSAKLNDEVEELKLIQTVNFKALSYKKTDLDNILEKMLEGFIPADFQLVGSDIEKNVEILGNSDATVLGLDQADLQVTIKASVIPEINEQELREKLVGLSFSDAEKVLGRVRNIKTYKIDINPNVPILRKLPSNIENISLLIEKD